MTKSRIEAIDVFRAITMFLMIFVNNFWQLSGVPHWMEHAAVDEDMLGLADIVFPSFLFIMGMSVPYAIRNRRAKGDSFWQLVFHIAMRTVALLVMGVVMVNYESLDPQASGISRNAFSALMVAAFFLIWGVYPKKTKVRYLFYGLQCLGIMILLYLYSVYAGMGGSHFSPRWWGILGLIGWSYLYCALAYLLTGDSVRYNVLAWLFFIGLSIFSAGGFAGRMGLTLLLPPDGGTLQAITMGGVLASVLLQNIKPKENLKRFVAVFGGLSVLLFVAFLIAHEFWIISKNQATPTWLFLSCAISFAFFILIYWLTDVMKKGCFFGVIRPAGTATLTCYLVPYLVYALIAALNLRLPLFWLTGIIGLTVALLYSLFCIRLTGVLVKLHIKLKI